MVTVVYVEVFNLDSNSRRNYQSYLRRCGFLLLLMNLADSDTCLRIPHLTFVLRWYQVIRVS